MANPSTTRVVQISEHPEYFNGTTLRKTDRNDNVKCPEDGDAETGHCCPSSIHDRESLLRVLKRKQGERTAELSRLSSQYKLGREELAIVELSWDDLINGLQTRQLTATQVLEAYIAKALDAHSKFNPITDFIPQAHEWAKELDNLKEVKGPLHGVPFCVKDDNNVEGMDTTHGYAKRLYNPAEESAVIVKVLQDLGAVPFCKTNVPQTLFTYGSDNPVFGTTLNATNPKLSPGGSSSGTGSLVGAHAAWFGTGTDIGGSLRIPAHFNGVSSIKPTGRRISEKGVVSSLPNVVGVTPAIGVIARTPTVVATLFKHLTENGKQTAYDPLALPIPWNETAFRSKKKLRIGYFTSLPYFPPIGDTEEVVLSAKNALESLGHTLVPFTMPDAYKYMNTFGKFILADHCRHFIKCWKGEEIAEGAKLVWLGSKFPHWFQRVLGSILSSKVIPFFHSKRTGVFFGSGAVSSTDLWDAGGVQKDIVNQMIADWATLELDAMISPLMPIPAPPVNAPGMLPTAVCYSAFWNLVDFPAGMVPFGFESGTKISSYDDQGDMALKLAKKCVKESVGAPIGVQVIGLPFQEETVLRVMTELEPFAAKSPSN